MLVGTARALLTGRAGDAATLGGVRGQDLACLVRKPEVNAGFVTVQLH